MDTLAIKIVTLVIMALGINVKNTTLSLSTLRITIKL